MMLRIIVYVNPLWFTGDLIIRCLMKENEEIQNIFNTPVKMIYTEQNF